jgi:LruC domain-containing protein
MDLNIIMIFPNTQDGEWPRGSYPNNKYNGNIGALRGDVVQLMYYPPTSDGGIDTSNGTTIFPAGTKIGFILKTNAWGQRGSDYAVNGSSYAKAKNIWAATTDGLSGAYDSGVKCPNPEGEARSAKFAYTAPNGNKYVVVSFEDACDDKDYDDLMFALNPANAFDLGDTPQIESKKTTVEGVYGFEDKWPEAGDYDMNDLMINCKHELEYYTHPDGSKLLNKERFYLTTYHNYITLQNGLAVDVQGSSISTIYINKLLPGQTKFASENYKMVKSKMYYCLPEIGWASGEPRMWYLTDDITKDEDKVTGEGVTWVIEVTYEKGLSKSGTTIRPFLWRKLDNGKQLEVHLPWLDPTSKADMSLFGTKADKSDPNVKKSNGQKMYYVGEGKFPFAFYLEGVSIDAFKNTSLKLENESKRIDTFFPEFLEWSISEGKQNSDWYLKYSTTE